MVGIMRYPPGYFRTASDDSSATVFLWLAGAFIIWICKTF